MANRSTFGEALFAHAPLPEAVQRILLGSHAEFQDAAARNPYGLLPDVWRACYTRSCPAARARGLLSQPTVRPEDVAWALTEAGERRAGPLETLLHQWYLDADQQTLLTARAVPATLASALAGNTDLLPQIRLAFANRLDARTRVRLLRAAPPGALDDDTLVAVTADVEDWPPGTWSSGKPVTVAQMLADAVDTFAVLAHRRPAVADAWAGSRVVTLAAAAAASPLPARAQRHVADTCVAGLGDPDLEAVAALGLLTLADRFDVTTSVRADAIDALLASGHRGDLVQAGVSGRRAVLPHATSAMQLSVADVELLLLRGSSSGPLSTQRALTLSELANLAVLDDELADRLITAMSSHAARSWECLDALLTRFPRLQDAAEQLRHSAERAADTHGKVEAAWQAAATPGAKRKRPVTVPTVEPLPSTPGWLLVSRFDKAADKQVVEAARWAAAELGDNPDTWRVAIAAAPGFIGTVRELVDVAHATVR